MKFCVNGFLRGVRHKGLLASVRVWAETKIVQPTCEMTSRQVVVSTLVGLWGGLFPFPPCTAPPTFACIMLYSASVPKTLRFNAPMTGLAVVLNELILPLDIMMFPVFCGVGQQIYGQLVDSSILDASFSQETLQELKEEPWGTLKRFSGLFGLGVASWSAATIPILGGIRCLGAASSRFRLAIKS